MILTAYDVGSVVAHIKADISDFERGINQARTGAKNFENNLSSVAGAVQKFALIAAAAGVAATAFLGKKAIEEAAAYEQQVIALTTLLGSEKKAQEQINIIRKDALKTPFEVSGLITGNQLLISAGVEAKQAEKDILNLGDALSANGKGAVELDRVLVNLQQIKNVGKANAMDMKQFAFNGINMFKLLSESTGKSIAELEEMDVTYEMISEALAKASAEGGKYHDANIRQSQSLNGIKSNYKDLFDQLLIGIANESGLFAATKKLAASFLQMGMDAMPKVIEGARQLGQFISSTTAFLSKYKDEIVLAADILIGIFLPALIMVGVEMIKNTAMSIGRATLSLIEFTIQSHKAIASMVLKTAQLIIAAAAFVLHTAVTGATTIATIAMTAATWLLNAALFVLTSPIFLVIAAIVALIAIGYLLITNWDTVKAFGQKMIDALVAAFWGFVTTLKNIGGHILSAIISPFENAWNTIQNLMKKIKDALDFTKRHSPSVVDIVEKGVHLVNKAFDDLEMPVDVARINTTPFANSTRAATVANVTIDMNDSIISDQLGAQRIGEIVGNSIVRKLQTQVRF